MSVFKRGDRVTKKSGSSWTGIVVGEYSTSLTPEGYAVESENEPGSVQIYPATALRRASPSPGEGMVMVPREPTADMLNAGLREADSGFPVGWTPHNAFVAIQGMKRSWNAMLKIAALASSNETSSTDDR